MNARLPHTPDAMNHTRMHGIHPSRRIDCSMGLQGEKQTYRAAGQMTWPSDHLFGPVAATEQVAALQQTIGSVRLRSICFPLAHLLTPPQTWKKRPTWADPSGGWDGKM